MLAGQAGGPKDNFRQVITTRGAWFFPVTVPVTAPVTVPAAALPPRCRRPAWFLSGRV
jgi:hypothetical protein